MFDAHKNLSYSTIAVAPSPGLSGTTATLRTGDGAKFPAVPFNVLIWPAGTGIPLTTNAEIARVTAMSGDAITAMTRATATEPNVVGPRTVVVGDQIAVPMSGKLLEDIEAAVSGSPFSVGTNVYNSAGSGVHVGLDTAEGAIDVGYISTPGYVSVPNNGTIVLGVRGGLWVVHYVSIDAFGFFAVGTSAVAPVLLADPNGTFSVAQGTASKINVYWSSTNLTLENKKGAASLISVSLVTAYYS
jgi:hypothetical protein